MHFKGENKCCHKKNAYKHGTFKRRSDGQRIQRYRCKTCLKSFSQATYDPAYYQKTRHLNYKCKYLLGSNVSMRRAAMILGIHRDTVTQKLMFLAEQCREQLIKSEHEYNHIDAIQFDELQTIEHTKCKPLSIAMAVSVSERKILGFQVSKMPATGHLAKISRKKYGIRPDQRKRGLGTLFKALAKRLPPTINIRSDECTYYRSTVNRYFPHATYQQFKGEKGCVHGQGELKKTVRDPLFCINHTFAMLRANINRLIRKTWCTTKKISRLMDHLTLYMWLHNSKLTPRRCL